MKKLLFTLMLVSQITFCSSSDDLAENILPVHSREELIFSRNVAAIKSIFDDGAKSNLQTFFQPLKYREAAIFKRFVGESLIVPIGKGVPVLTQDQAAGREKFLVMVKRSQRDGTTVWFLTSQEKGGMLFRNFLPLINPALQEMRLEHVFCASINNQALVDDQAPAPAQFFAGFICFVGEQLYIVDDSSDLEAYRYDLEDDEQYPAEQYNILTDNAGDTDAPAPVHYQTHHQIHHKGFTPFFVGICPECSVQ